MAQEGHHRDSQVEQVSLGAAIPYSEACLSVETSEGHWTGTAGLEYIGGRCRRDEMMGAWPMTDLVNRSKRLPCSGLHPIRAFLNLRFPDHPLVGIPANILPI